MANPEVAPRPPRRWPARRWLLGGAVLAAAAVVLVGWVVTRPRECPASGCRSSVRIDLLSLDPAVRVRAATADVCVEGTCTFAVITDNQPNVLVAHDRRTVASASITIADRDGAVVQRLELTHEVDGAEVRTFDDDCVPACWAITLAARDGALDRR